MRYLWEAIKNRHGVLLEIGSSAGKHLRSVLELGHGFECHGTDIDADSVKLGHRVCPLVLFSVADGHRLPYSPESFDAVVIMDYLEHVNNPRVALDEAFRVLKKNGLLCAFIPCEDNSLSVFHLFKRVFGFNVKKPAGGHVHDFRLSDVGELLAMTIR